MASRTEPSEYAKKAGRAVRHVGAAVRAGLLVRQPCVDCGAEKVQAHHHNGYAPEHELDVTWLCPKLQVLERLWDMLLTDEERAAVVAVIEKLAASEPKGERE